MGVLYHSMSSSLISLKLRGVLYHPISSSLISLKLRGVLYHSISSSLISLKLMGVLYHSMLSTEYPLILKSPVTCFLGESHKSSHQMVISTCYWKSGSPHP